MQLNVLQKYLNNWVIILYNTRLKKWGFNYQFNASRYYMRYEEHFVRI